MSTRRLISRVFPHNSEINRGNEAQPSKSLSHKLLQRMNLLEPLYPGAYILNSYLFRSLQKLERLIDQNLEAVGGQRIMMPSLAPAPLWKTTGRWERMGEELFKLTDRTDAELCLAPTHEETVCSMVSRNTSISHKRLPLLLYQITTKFRDEPHPKHALLRGKEFIMKDMYTFDEDISKAKDTYQQVIRQYKELFSRLQLPVYQVEADTGMIGGSLSHEFQVAADIGEDEIVVCTRCGHACNSEINKSDTRKRCLQCDSDDTKSVNGIELGHAFLLGDKYSKPLEVTYRDSHGKPRLCEMGCYGLGVTRIVAAAIETMSTETEIRWPKLIAPYAVIVIPQKKGYKFEKTLGIAEDVYDRLEAFLPGDVVFDDRHQLSIGNRVLLASALGFRYAVCVGRNALEENCRLEIVDIYDNKKSIFVDRGDCVQTLKDLNSS